jgi:hypothetical protein
VADGGREPMRAGRVFRRLGVADDGAERAEHVERADSKRVVVEGLGELECRPGLIERRDEPVPKTCRPRKPTVNDRLKSRPRGGFAQSFLEQLNGTADAFEVRDQDESLGAQRADLRLRKQLGRDTPRTRPLSGGLMRTSCGQRSAMAFVVFVRRREPERVFEQFCCEGRRTTIGRQNRGVVEHTGDLGVRCVSGQRKVAGAEERIFDDFRDTSVDTCPPLAQVQVEDRRKQRVREANRPVLALDHVCHCCRFERACLNARPLEQSLRRRAERCGEGKRLASGRGERVDPRAYELFERLGNRERLERIDILVEKPG